MCQGEENKCAQKLRHELFIKKIFFFMLEHLTFVLNCNAFSILSLKLKGQFSYFPSNWIFVH